MHNNFINLSHQVRNIVNINDINNEITQIIHIKKLDNFPNVKTWVESIVKNYVLKKLDVLTFEKNNLFELPENVQHFIFEKKILPPYNTVNISSKFKDQVFHCIDYLQSNFNNNKDLSRISFEQACINAENWLIDRLKNLSNVDDSRNVFEVKSFIYEDKKFSWVNIRSHKALEYESKMMNHCIETYWDKDYPNEKVISTDSSFYSLRDDNNKPIVTLFGNLDSKNNKFIIEEIKEKNNKYLSHKNRPLVDILLENKEIKMNQIEQELSHYYLSNPTMKIQSINKIIEAGNSFITNTSLFIEDFENDFPKEKLYNIDNWDKLHVKEQDNFTKLQAKEVIVEEVKNKKFQIRSCNLYLKNIKESIIDIENIKTTTLKKNLNIKYFENIHNCTINLLFNNMEDNYYIFKNCSNVKIGNDILHPQAAIINILKINCVNIDFTLSNRKNILDINLSKNSYNYILNNGSGTYSGNNIIETEDKITRNKFFENVLNVFLKSHSFIDNDQLFLNFCKQIKINIHQLENKSNLVKVYLNKEITLYDYNSLFSAVFLDAEKFLKSEFEKFEEKNYKNYNQFIEENTYYILKKDLNNKYNNSDITLLSLITKIENTLSDNRELLIDSLTNKEDNFLEYIDNIFQKESKDNKLLIYMFKNEVMQQALIHYNENNPSNYRFAFTEMHITKNVAKRWIDYIFETIDNAEKTNLLNILVEPLDNNNLLNKFKKLYNKENIYSETKENHIDFNINTPEKKNKKIF